MISEDKIQNLNASEFKALFDQNKETVRLIQFDYTECTDVERDVEFLRIPQFTEANPLVVEGYPYGRLRTRVRYYVETTKRGDRFVFQSKNPKTDKWNNPKKGTYNAVQIMIVNSDGHITTMSIDFNHKELNIKNKYEAFKEFFTKEQKIQLAQVFGYTKVMKNVTFEFRPASLDKSENEKRDNKQKEITDKINRAVGYESQKAFLDMED